MIYISPELTQCVELLKWDCVTSVQAHQGSLSALTIVHHPSTQSLCIVTGGSDATLQVFQYALEEGSSESQGVVCGSRKALLD